MTTNKKIMLTLDTSAINPEEPIIKQLQQWGDEGLVYLGIDIHSKFEKERWENHKKEGTMDWMYEHGKHSQEAFFIRDGKDIFEEIDKSRGYTNLEEEDVERRIINIMAPEINEKNPLGGKKTLSKWVDWKLLKNHILQKREYFIT